jgi:cytochrome c oxidase subunit 2
MLDSLPDPASSYAADIDHVIRLIYWITGAFFVLAEGFLIWCIVRYRRKQRARGEWQPGTSRKAVMFVIAPAAIILVFDLVIEAASHRVWSAVKEDIPAHDVLVRARGHRYFWNFTYAGPDGKLDTEDDYGSMGELFVPKDKVVRLQFESADVLHSFHVPELRLKQDCVPGRSIPGWFKAIKLGDYAVGCAELCGASHTRMVARLHVMSPADYDAWTTTQIATKSQTARSAP